MSGYGNVANLKHFEPGNKAQRFSAKVFQAIAQCRKVAPEAVDYVISAMRDPEAPQWIRLKAAELILERAMPKRENSLVAQMALSETGAVTLRLEIVDAANDMREPETITITPNANGHDEPIALSIADDTDGRDNR